MGIFAPTGIFRDSQGDSAVVEEITVGLREHQGSRYSSRAHGFVACDGSRHSISTPTPDLVAISVEHIWHRRQKRRDSAQDGQSPMRAHVFVEGDRIRDTPARRHISNQSDRCECRSGILLVAVNDVLVACDEDAEDAVAEEDTRG